MYNMHLKARGMRQGKRRGVNDNGKALNGIGNGDGEALRMTEGMEDNGEVPHMRKIAMVRR